MSVKSARDQLRHIQERRREKLEAALAEVAKLGESQRQKLFAKKDKKEKPLARREEARKARTESERLGIEILRSYEVAQVAGRFLQQLREYRQKKKDV